MKICIIFDTGITELNENRLFIDAAAMSVHHTVIPTCHLGQRLVAAGYDVMTPDVYWKLPVKPKQAYIFSHLYREETERLIATGVVPLILTCQESPYIASRFYMSLKMISDQYLHSFVFSGMQKKLGRHTKYHQMFFPNFFDINSFAPADFSQRKFLVAVVSAKGIDSYLKKILLSIYYLYNVKEINAIRRQAIKYYAKSNDFDLFGAGWDNTSYNDLKRDDIMAVNRGVLPWEKKKDIVSQYKFSICFENSIFPGYITEKIFDCFFAGVVPIYYGDQNVLDYIPENCFIDFRKYRNWDSLDSYLKSIGEKEYHDYIQNIRDYLGSEAYYKFSEEYFISQVMEIIKKETEYAQA